MGLRTKKTARLEQDSPESPTAPFSLGLSQDSVKYYSMGQYSGSGSVRHGLGICGSQISTFRGLLITRKILTLPTSRTTPRSFFYRRVLRSDIICAMAMGM